MPLLLFDRIKRHFLDADIHDRRMARWDFSVPAVSSMILCDLLLTKSVCMKLAYIVLVQGRKFKLRHDAESPTPLLLDELFATQGNVTWSE